MSWPIDHVRRRANSDAIARSIPNDDDASVADAAVADIFEGAAPLSTAVLELQAVGRVFDTDPPVAALRDIDLRVDPGEYVAVVGPSGSGKSTLLNVLGLLDRPTSGRYLLDGVDVSGLGDAQRTAWRAERLGFIFQAFHLLPNRTALENVMFGQLYQGGPRRERRARAMAALARVGVAHRAAFLPGKLSGGERQRVAVARALAMEPSLLLCDEPTGNLDSANTASILDLFDELLSDGLTIVVITHDSNVAARAQRRVTITDGCLVEDCVGIELVTQS